MQMRFKVGLVYFDVHLPKRVLSPGIAAIDNGPPAHFSFPPRNEILIESD